MVAKHETGVEAAYPLAIALEPDPVPAREVNSRDPHQSPWNEIAVEISTVLLIVGG